MHLQITITGPDPLLWPLPNPHHAAIYAVAKDVLDHGGNVTLQTDMAGTARQLRFTFDWPEDMKNWDAAIAALIEFERAYPSVTS